MVSGETYYRKLALGIGAKDLWDKVDDGSYETIPFSEHINFSDADGVIGPVASKKLYNDYVTIRKRYNEYVRPVLFKV